MNDVFGTFRCPQCGIRGRVIKVKFDKKTKSRVNHQKRNFYWQLICPLDGCNVTKLPHPEPDYYKKEGDFCGKCCYFHTFQCDRGKLHLRTSDPCEKFRRKTYNNSSKKEVVAMVEKEVAAFVDYREQKVVIGERSQVTKLLLACPHECEIYANVDVLKPDQDSEKKKLILNDNYEIIEIRAGIDRLIEDLKENDTKRLETLQKLKEKMIQLGYYYIIN